MIKRIVVSIALAALSAGAWAQAYPSRPVTLVIGFPPGGGADAVARIVTEKLGKLLGQPVVVDNKPGAGTTIASEFVARAPADGYTLLLGSANLYGSDQMLYKSAKYEGAKSFTPISRWSSAPMLLAVRKDFEAQSVRELVTQARAAPDKFSYSSSGAGVVTHLAGLSFAQANGIKMLHVPFKGGAPSIQAVGAGEQVFIAEGEKDADALAAWLNNRTITPRLPGSMAQTTLSRRFFLASVISLEMGCCAPVRMMGLSAFWMR